MANNFVLKDENNYFYWGNQFTPISIPSYSSKVPLFIYCHSIFLSNYI